MIIIKKHYRFEAAHKLVSSHSKRCRENIHGHSYKVNIRIKRERLLKNEELNEDDMVVDFGLLKPIGEFIDKLDHSIIVKEGSAETEYNKRVVELDRNPTAEILAMLILQEADKIVKKIDTLLSVTAVEVYETENSSAIAVSDGLFDETKEIKFKIKN